MKGITLVSVKRMCKNVNAVIEEIEMKLEEVIITMDRLYALQNIIEKGFQLIQDNTQREKLLQASRLLGEVYQWVGGLDE